ncbi:MULTISPECIES: hypothetical protein [Clostridium]|uniref:Uncharacterized protein n=3 Tax=Clostridium TaxID=1485 RepID=A0A166TUS8_9CLOT|nr:MULTISPECIES: hypothetical protein [Clostridium]ADK14910.1 putative membrane protein [Clostridium ljungdahlii DSM 13528]AGY78156.1 hypothetical protein CAETHG_3955 [Clostridium autoethanogenum DSM 10061]ALU38289.1 Hypothetical protein CLAU_3862 [Clostridium autoethanogenum DSM 10061]OAA87905.1 hypothetical protein WX45_03389 [Clostridium ljungdahlii DSM 13528]OAA94121.1 hypothetical protein WX73_03691 [Clostridium coskatii]
MYHAKRNLIYFIFQTIFGIIALLFFIFGDFANNHSKDILSGIGISFTIAGVIGIATSLKLLKDPKKAAKIEMAQTEERTQFIKAKTKSFVYTIMIYLESAVIIVTGLLGFRTICITLSAIVLLKVILNLIFSNYYMKKY